MGVMALDVLFASYASMALSCRLRSFAHFANSSWELVAFISRLSWSTSRFKRLCSAVIREVGLGSLT